MRVSRYLLTVLLAAVLAGCNSLSVRTDFDPTINFSRPKTYNWLPAPAPTGDVRIDGNTLLQDRIRSAVDRVLLSKGYTMAGSAAPDFLVGYHATVQSKTNVTTVNDRYGPGYGAGWGHGSVQVYEYDEGLLILDIVDPVGKKLLWRGSASDVVSQSRSVDARQEQLQEAVTKILENFPPRPKK